MSGFGCANGEIARGAALPVSSAITAFFSAARRRFLDRGNAETARGAAKKSRNAKRRLTQPDAKPLNFYLT